MRADQQEHGSNLLLKRRMYKVPVATRNLLKELCRAWALGQTGRPSLTPGVTNVALRALKQPQALARSLQAEA